MTCIFFWYLLPSCSMTPYSVELPYQKQSCKKWPTREESTEVDSSLIYDRGGVSFCFCDSTIQLLFCLGHCKRNCHRYLSQWFIVEFTRALSVSKTPGFTLLRSAGGRKWFKTHYQGWSHRHHRHQHHSRIRWYYPMNWIDNFFISNI